MEQPTIECTVSEFVASVNQTLDIAYGSIVITGELANFRISKQRWVYFDLKDDEAMVRFFGSIYQLSGPLEDGMLVKVRGTPRLHPQYGFSVTFSQITPAGEGSIKRAAALLEAKLTAEGLFDPSRKRLLAYPPRRIGLVTSMQSAAYADFIKIIGARWPAITIDVVDVQVQGEAAPEQIVRAVEHFNSSAQPPDAIVLIRGGGSAEDLAAFSTEVVTRAVAASRVPTLVAIGHEVDLSLAELAADTRASTPSNAAELLVPDRLQVLAALQASRSALQSALKGQLSNRRESLKFMSTQLTHVMSRTIDMQRTLLQAQSDVLAVLNPTAILGRGYTLVRDATGNMIRSAHDLSPGAIVNIVFHDGQRMAQALAEQQKKGKA